jgi:hypothetical protein
MKNITNQYKDLKEGRISQSNFMRNLRMTFPHLVTNVTSFDDSIKILKNKGLLSEEKTKAADVSPKQIKAGTKVEKEHTKSNKKARKIATDHLTKEDPKYYTKLKKAGLEETNKATADQIQKKYNEMFGKNPQTTFADVAKALGITEQEIAIALMTPELSALKEGVSGKEEYAKFNEVDNLNGQEVLIGIDCELQMDPELSKEEATKIAVKNLKKDPYYYTNYKLAGKEATTEPMYKYKEGSDQMKPIKGENTLIDKDNGMKSPKGIEKIKASAAKANKETNKTIKGVEYMKLTAKTVRGVKRMDATGEKMKKVNVKEGQMQEAYPKDEFIVKGGGKKDFNLDQIEKRLSMIPSALKAQDTTPEIKDLINNLINKIQSLNNNQLSDQEVITALMKLIADKRKPVKESLKSLIKQIIKEELQNGELSSKEDAVVRDILSTYWEEKATKTLEENKYSESVAKVKDYLKKGMITAGVAAVLASCSPEINYYPTTGRGTSYDKKPMTRSQRACPSKYMQDNYKRPKTVQLKRR